MKIWPILSHLREPRRTKGNQNHNQNCHHDTKSSSPLESTLWWPAERKQRTAWPASTISLPPTSAKKATASPVMAIFLSESDDIHQGSHWVSVRYTLRQASPKKHGEFIPNDSAAAKKLFSSPIHPNLHCTWSKANLPSSPTPTQPNPNVSTTHNNMTQQNNITRWPNWRPWKSCISKQ